jgi:hypothetical protein
VETKEYRTIDKTKWRPGPWRDEPDKIQWQDGATGLPCLIVRNSMGALCGYVGVAEGHPWFDKDYNRGKVTGCGDTCDHENEYHYQCTPAGSLRVHGGITFSDFCQPHDTEDDGICHLPAPGEPERVYWFGFDCGHHGDGIPARNFQMQMGYSQYRDIEYVRAEVRQLAAQLKAVASQATYERSIITQCIR